MALSPQKFREILFQLIYSADFSSVEDEDMIPFLMQEHEVPKKVIREAQDRKKALDEVKEEIDRVLRKSSQDYELERIPKVERNILRVGIYELIYSTDIPPKVAIAEAIRLSRKYASPEGASFVNAILGTLYSERTAIENPEPLPEKPSIE